MRLWLILAIGLAGCNGCGATEEPVGNTDDEGEGASASSGVATIEGTVRLAVGATLGRYPDQPMVGGPARPALPDNCTAPSEEDRVPVRQAAGGGLIGVLVAVADFAREIEHEPVRQELNITDCRLSPRLITATRGDTLVLRNDTDYPFMPDLGTGMLQAVLYENERELPLGQGGVRSITCGFAAPCGRADVVTMYHPLHIVTDDAGHYRIEGVPAGEEIRVNAWHPIYQETNETLTLRADETRTIDFVLTPVPVQEAPEQASTFEGHPEDNPDIPIF